jgi:hypothetical protein
MRALSRRGDRGRRGGATRHACIAWDLCCLVRIMRKALNGQREKSGGLVILAVRKSVLCFNNQPTGPYTFYFSFQLLLYYCTIVSTTPILFQTQKKKKRNFDVCAPHLCVKKKMSHPFSRRPRPSCGARALEHSTRKCSLALELLPPPII